MARVQQIDVVYLDMRRPAVALDALREAIAAQARRDAGLPLTVLRDDGSPYDIRGRLLFSGISVEPDTGDILLRGQMDNPQQRLLPGMFVRVRLPLARFEAALTVPQQAVVRRAGRPQVWVVGPDAKARTVVVELGELSAGRYRIRAGLQAGQQVVVAGMERLVERAEVQVQPATPASSPVHGRPVPPLPLASVPAAAGAVASTR